MLRASIIYGIAGSASRFITLLLVPIYTRLFQPGEYGVLDLLTTTAVILVLVSGMQVESGVARSYFEARAAGKKETLVGTGLLLYLLGTAIWSCAFLLVAALWLAGYAGITWAQLTPLLLALLPTHLLNLQLLLLRYESRPAQFVTLSLSDVTLSSVFSIIAVVSLGWGIAGVLWGLLASKVCCALLGAVVLRERWRATWSGDFAREILWYSVPLIPAVLTSWLLTYANRFLLAATVSLEQLGIFSLAMKVAMGITLVTTTLRLAWEPRAMALLGGQEAPRQIARTLHVYLVAMLLLCGAITAASKLVVVVVADPTYVDAARLIGFLVMGLLWNGAVSIGFAFGLIAVRKTYLNVAGFALGAFVNIALLWATVGRWGIAAAGVTYLLGSLGTALLILAFSQRHYPIPYRYPLVAAVILASVAIPALSYRMWTPVTSAVGLGVEALTHVALYALLCLPAALLVAHYEGGAKLSGTFLAPRR